MTRCIPLKPRPCCLVCLKKAPGCPLSSERACKVILKTGDFKGHQGTRRPLMEGKCLLGAKETKAQRVERCSANVIGFRYTKTRQLFTQITCSSSSKSHRKDALR